MIKKIARKKFLTNFPNYPQVNNYRNTFFYPEPYNAYILYVESKSTSEQCRRLSIALTKLVQILQYENLTFLGDTTTPWLFRDHDYKPVKSGLDYLVANGITKSFNGAVQVGVTDLPEFINHLFWLIRCNGIVIYTHFSDPGFSIMASICQYGNIHFNTLNKETDEAFNNALIKTKLKISIEKQCGNLKSSNLKAV